MMNVSRLMLCCVCALALSACQKKDAAAENSGGKLVRTASGSGGPTVTLTPPYGGLPGGDALTLSFSATPPKDLTLAFQSAGNEAALKCTLSGGASAQCTTPAWPVAETVSLVLRGTAFDQTIPEAFTYRPAPRLSSISPNRGGFSGGIAVTLTGENFFALTQVQGGQSTVIPPMVIRGRTTRDPRFCEGVTVAPGGKQLSCRLLAVDDSTSGAVDVTVRNPDGQSVTLKGFTFAADASPAQLSVDNTTSDFGDVTVGLTATRQIVVRNDGQTAAAALAVTGVLPPFSTLLTTCGPTLAVQATCSYTLTFSPLAAGVARGTFTLSYGSAGSVGADRSVGVALTGRGLSRASLGFVEDGAFGSVLLGGTRARVFNVTNGGGTTAINVAISTIGDAAFAQTATTCGATLAAGAGCTISIAFTPTRSGAVAGTLRVGYGTPGLPVVGDARAELALSGSGSARGALALSPAAIDFGDVTVAKTSSRTLRLTNSGDVTTTNLAISGLSGALTQTNDCGTQLAGGAGCNINVTFAPVAAGIVAETLGVAYSSTGAASGTDQTTTASLRGRGLTVAALALSPATIDFGDVTVAKTSSQTLRLTNSGDIAATNLAISGLSGSLTQTSDCGTQLAGGAGCNINVTFAPTASGTVAQTLGIAYSSTGAATGTDQTTTASLRGRGRAVAALAIAPATIDFGNVTVQKTAGQTLRLTNSGDIAATNLAIGGLSGSLTQTNDCGTQLAGGAGCNINVTFAPVAAGIVAETLGIAYSSTGAASGTDQTTTASLRGRGLTVAALALSPATIDFGDVTVAKTSSQTLRLTNSGDIAATNLAISGISGPLTQTNDCGTQLSGGAGCNINVTFAPTASGTVAQTLGIAYSSTGAATGTDQTTTASLRGRGVIPASLSLDESSFAFGAVAVGDTRSHNVKVTNTGGLPATGLVVSGISGDFSVKSNACGATLAAGSDCTIAIGFAPSAAAARQATLSVTFGGAAAAVTDALAGQGITPAVLALGETSFAFGDVRVGSPVAHEIRVTNSGQATATQLSFSGLANEFGYTTTCGTSLAGGASCAVTVTVTPVAAVVSSATLTVAYQSLGLSSGTNSSVADSLTSTGVTIVGGEFFSLATGSSAITAAPANYRVPDGKTLYLTGSAASSSACTINGAKFEPRGNGQSTNNGGGTISYVLSAGEHIRLEGLSCTLTGYLVTGAPAEAGAFFSLQGGAGVSYNVPAGRTLMLTSLAAGVGAGCTLNGAPFTKGGRIDYRIAAGLSISLAGECTLTGYLAGAILADAGEFVALRDTQVTVPPRQTLRLTRVAGSACKINGAGVGSDDEVGYLIAAGRPVAVNADCTATGYLARAELAESGTFLALAGGASGRATFTVPAGKTYVITRVVGTCTFDDRQVTGALGVQALTQGNLNYRIAAGNGIAIDGGACTFTGYSVDTVLPTAGRIVAIAGPLDVSASQTLVMSGFGYPIMTYSALSTDAFSVISGSRVQFGQGWKASGTLVDAKLAGAGSAVDIQASLNTTNFKIPAGQTLVLTGTNAQVTGCQINEANLPNGWSSLDYRLTGGTGGTRIRVMGGCHLFGYLTGTATP